MLPAALSQDTNEASARLAVDAAVIIWGVSVDHGPSTRLLELSSLATLGTYLSLQGAEMETVKLD